jgi:ubiquitin-activating enzyme E1
MPIKQFFYFDAIECLPENVDQSVINPKVSRYYSQEIIFGENFQHQLGQLKYFIV